MTNRLHLQQSALAKSYMPLLVFAGAWAFSPPTGLAQDDASRPQPSVRSQDKPDESQAEKPLLALVPQSAMIAVQVRFDAIADKPPWKPVRSLLREALAVNYLGARAISAEHDEIEQALVFATWNTRQRSLSWTGAAVRYSEDAENLENESASSARADGRRFLMERYFEHGAGENYSWLPDDRTVVITTGEDLIRGAITNSALWKTGAPPPWTALLEHPVVGFVSGPALGKRLQTRRSEPLDQFVVAALSPLWRNAEPLCFALDFNDDPLVINAVVPGAAGNKGADVAKTILSAGVFGLGVVRERQRELRESADEPDPAAAASLAIAASLLENLRIDRTPEDVEARTRTSRQLAVTALELLAPRINELHDYLVAQRRASDLHELAQAVISYHDTHRRFPPAVVMGGPNDDVPRSWRVELLPFLGYDELYDEYRKNEPWDSDHNKKLLGRMPEVFRSLAAPPSSESSSYYAIVGPDTVFEPDAKIGLRSVTDGTYNTLLFVEVERDIPWTKPEDITYDPQAPLPKLGGYGDTDVITAVAVGGPVYAIPDDSSEEVLRSFIERNDGQAVNLPEPVRPPRR